MRLYADDGIDRRGRRRSTSQDVPLRAPIVLACANPGNASAGQGGRFGPPGNPGLGELYLL